MNKKYAVVVVSLLAIVCFVCCSCNFANQTTVTIKYNYNSDQPSQYLSYRNTVFLPTPNAKEGYVFVGWCLDESCEHYFDVKTAIDFLAQDNKQTWSLELYAKWEKAEHIVPPSWTTHTVTFDLNGGSGNTPTQSVEQGKTVTLPTNITKNGCTFVGWFTSQTGGVLWTSTTAVTQDVTLYARWQNDETPPSPSPNVMPTQQYDNGDSHQTVQQRMEAEGYDYGMPSTGEYKALVIPVLTTGTFFDAFELERLKVAFNGTSQQTGWHSVNSYYKASSFGQLNLTFDFTDVFECRNYDQLQPSVDVLQQALTWLDGQGFDFSKYDYNEDGLIDGIYLIYDHDVDYDDEESPWWAYTEWYTGEETYDGLYAYAYVFAGLDFMNDYLDEEYYSNVKINAETYIHETGHMLDLDDYYDYEESKGCNEGLGGADIMDSTVGDHNVYSKMISGWLTPTVVTTSGTYTVSYTSASQQFLMLLLDYNGNDGYFSEYLLVDLYSPTLLNAFHQDYLFGSQSGVRIYHVASSDNQHFTDEDYPSFTDNNNSTTNNALICIVEADGETKFVSTNGYADTADLWQQGDSLSDVFPTFSRYDGKRVNFDLQVLFVDEQTAQVQVTFFN